MTEHTPTPWPNFCHDPDSCERHQACMYVQCRRYGHDITNQIRGAVQRLAEERAGLHPRICVRSGEAMSENCRVNDCQKRLLVAALEEIANQKTTDDNYEEYGEDFAGDYESRYDAIIRIARAALNGLGVGPTLKPESPTIQRDKSRTPCKNR